VLTEPPMVGRGAPMTRRKFGELQQDLAHDVSPALDAVAQKADIMSEHANLHFTG
jgi:hypothetical protein